MRKFSLLLIAMLVVSGAAFAEDAVAFIIDDASASATFGYDLDGASSGFTNTAVLDLRITLIDDQTAEYGTDGELRGYLKLDDFALDIDVADAETAGAAGAAFNVDSVSITGQVFMGPAYVKIYGASDNVDEAIIVDGSDAVSLITPVFTFGAGDTTYNTANTTLVPIGIGTSVGDMLDLELILASEANWDTNANNVYLVAARADIDVAGFNIDVEASSWVNKDFDTDGTSGFGEQAAVGVGLTYSLPVDDFTLSPYVGFDLQSTADTGATTVTSRYELLAGANLTWAGTDENTEVTVFGQKERVQSGVGVDFLLQNNGNTVTTDDPMIIRVGLYESNGDDGLLPVLGAAFVTEIRMTGSNMDLGVAAELRANLGTLRPYFGVMLQDEAVAGVNGNLEAAINIGASVHVIDNVTFTIDYASGNLAGEAVADTAGARSTAAGALVYGDGVGALDGAARLGEVSLTTKIDY